MSQSKSSELAEQFKTQNDAYVAFVNGCNDALWRSVVPGEEWTVGAMFYHIGDGHYSVTAALKRAVRGDDIPQFSSAQMDERNAAHADNHAAYTQKEVAELLTVNGNKIYNFVASLSDEQLATRFYFKLFDRDVSVGGLFKTVVLRSCYEHFGHVLELQQSLA